MDNTQMSLVLAVARSRVVASRLLGGLVLFLAIFSTHSFRQEGMADVLFEISGLLLLVTCSAGRLWAMMYISGNKRRQLVTDGPYSIVRNPLYLFSLIGALGLGLASENFLILFLILVFYLLYYPATIFAEEIKLIEKFGQSYREYMQRTPRFLPRPSLYKTTESVNVKTAPFVRNFISGMWFVWIFPLLHFIESLQNSGYLPVLFRIP